MTMHHRTWFPFILIGLSTALLLVVVVFLDGRTLPTAISTEDYIAAIDSIDYPADISSALRNYYETEDIEEARDRLLAQRVPAQFRDVHFELILIVNAYQQGETLEAETRMNALRLDYAWLP